MSPGLVPRPDPVGPRGDDATRSGFGACYEDAAELALPYHGDDPIRLVAVAARVGDARAVLARIHDALSDARQAIATSWTGRTGALGAAEVDRLVVATERAVDRLDAARRALLDCADEVAPSRSAIDLLRVQWEYTASRRRWVRFALAGCTEPGPLGAYQEELRVLSDRLTELRWRWDSQAAVADEATAACSCRLRASRDGVGSPASPAGRHRRPLGPGPGHEPGRRVPEPTSGTPAGLGAALGTGLLVSANLFREVGADRAGWERMSPAARRYALLSAGRFSPAAGSPGTVAAGWSTLSGVQRQALIDADPQRIGALDGLPAADRDQANRLYLTRRRLEVDRQLAATRKPAPPPRPLVAGLDWRLPAAYSVWEAPDDVALEQRRLSLQVEQDNLQRIADQSGPVGRFLISCDVTGRGRAVIAVGNPDSASQVAVYVPGTGSDLESLGTELVRSERMRAAAGLAGAEMSAVIAWVGYDAPPGFPSAAYDSYADTAGPVLNSFADGLRAAHQGTPALTTVVAHSYAGLVVAESAAEQDPLDVDRLVLVASAGLEVPAVTDLHLAGVPAAHTAERVFSTVTPNDIINVTGWVHESLPSGADFGTTPFAADPYPDSWLGRMLALPQSFAGALPGAPSTRGFPISVGAHSSYWDEGSTSLAAMGRIIAGSAPRPASTPPQSAPPPSASRPSPRETGAPRPPVRGGRASTP